MVSEWFILGVFAAVVGVLFVFCDVEHFIPKWAFRLLVMAAGLQVAGYLFDRVAITTMAQLISFAGLFWIGFGLVQDMKLHRHNQ